MCGSASTTRASASCWACDAVRTATAGAQFGVQAVRQLPTQSAPTAASAARNSSSRGGGCGDQQVVADRAEEDVVLLGDQHDLPAQPLRAQLGDRYPAHRHRAGARRVDARQQPAQRGLAGAGRADDGQPFARAVRSGRRRAARRGPGRRRSAHRSPRSGRPPGAGAAVRRRLAAPRPGPRPGRRRRRCSAAARPRSGSSSSGADSCRRYSAAATTAPRLTAPCACSTPPSSSTPATGKT